MNANIELNSIAMSKNDPKITKLDKYDVEANIEEIANDEEQSMFKYGFTALSNPKNVRLGIEGMARITGDAVERNELLEKDDNDVPKILTMIYNELFPTFFLLSKSLNVACPPHTIGAMGSPPSEIEEPGESETIVTENTENISPPEPAPSPEIPAQEETIENSDVVQPTV